MRVIQFSLSEQHSPSSTVQKLRSYVVPVSECEEIGAIRSIASSPYIAYVGLGDIQGEGEYYYRHRDHWLSGVHRTIPGRTSHACPVRNPTTGHFSCSAACKDNRGCIRDLLNGPDKESHQVDRQGSLLTRLEADRIQEIAQDVLCAAESLEVAMSMQRAGSGFEKV